MLKNFNYLSLLFLVLKPFFLWPSPVQDSQDSLVNALSSIQSDEQRAEAYYQLALLQAEDLKLGTANAESSLNLFSSIDDLNGIVKSSVLLGEYYYKQDSLKKSAFVLKSIEEIEQEYWTETALFKYNNYLGIINEFSGNYLVSIEFFLTAFSEAEKATDTLNMGISTHNLAGLYTLMDSVDLAIEKQKEALKYFEKVNHFNYTTNAYVNMAQWYFMSGEYERSKYYQNIAQNRLIESSDYYGLVFNYEGIALVYKTLNEPDTSYFYFKQGLTLLENHSDEIANANWTKVYLLVGLAETYYEFGEKDSALRYIQLAHREAKSFDSFEDFQTVYLPLSTIYEDAGLKDSALHFYKLYHEVSDKKFKEGSKKSIANVLLKHELLLLEK
ncbi:MAG: hypothetical protein N4A46_15815, partial [Schleiferiaceae bacterium]|nr:hypothetical protein [Schleiferiaceae bacterium]